MDILVNIPGIGVIPRDSGFIPLEKCSDGRFEVAKDGVESITATGDRKIEFIAFKNHTLAYVKSSMGYPAYYPLNPVEMKMPAKAVLMDLDGTSVRSEEFWMWIIEKTVSKLTDNPKFMLEAADEPFVSGHSVSEHLKYCINKYCPEKTVEEARKHYFDITEFEMEEIMQGRGRVDAFVPTHGLKEFLYELKGAGVKIGLVTSGLYQKAWPEILSAFRTLKMGDPAEFYDAIITAGTAMKKGQPGTLGELEPKPHPWLYAETARVGLGMETADKNRVVGLEDSAAGIVSIRLAGFAAIGIEGGNIEKSGVHSLINAKCKDLTECLPMILGK